MHQDVEAASQGNNDLGIPPRRHLAFTDSAVPYWDCFRPHVAGGNWNLTVVC